MKKRTKRMLVLLLVALPVAAALLVAGCDLFPGQNTGAAPGADGTVNADGTINLSIRTRAGNSAASRAMVPGTSKSVINYYEVIFQYGTTATDFVRTSWYNGQSPRVSIPPRIYNGNTPSGTSGRAIILAGTNNVGTIGEYTLLAVGFMTTTNAGGSGDTAVTVVSGTTSVTFTMYALDAAPALTGGAFAITGGGAVTSVPIGDATVPMFQIAKNQTNGAGKYTITQLSTVKGGTDSSASAIGTYLVPLSTTAPSGALYSTGVISQAQDAPVILDTGSQIGAITTLASGEIPMLLKTGAVDGLTMLAFDVPVKATMDTFTVPGAIEWHIRPGLFNYQLDRITTGTAANTTSGGILVLIGTASSNLASNGILINVGYP